MALSDRAVKAMTLLIEGLGDARTATGERLIESQAKPGAFYVVSANSCSCKDSQYRSDKVCKHRLALALEQTLIDHGAIEARGPLRAAA